MKISKVILTGPTGAVGVSVIQELISNGIEVTAVCRPNSKRISAIPNHRLVHVVECDISKLFCLKNILSHDYDTFYHFAWDGTFGDTRQNIRLQANNILYTLDAVELAATLGCKSFVGAGSQSEFGHVNGVLHPYMPCNPDNGYGLAKLEAGRMSRLLCKQYGIRHEWCRIVSLYGPYDGDYTMVMSIIQKMLRGQRVSATKGDQIWDYIYSKDAARAFRLVAEKDGGVENSSVYCFGTGKTRRLKDFILAIRNAIDPTLEVSFGELPYYPNQVMHLEADISNLTADTGFTPQYEFETGIQETIDWARSTLPEKSVHTDFSADGSFV